MITNPIYLHPRSIKLYEFPDMRKFKGDGKQASRPQSACSTRVVDVQTSTIPTPTMANTSDSIVDKRGSFLVYYPEESYSTENVAETLRHKQRMRARRALESMATTSGGYSFRGHSRSHSSSSSSTVSSRASSPPSTPRLMPIDLPFPEQGDELVVIESMRSKSEDMIEPPSI
ncbi:hypothetical protein PYCCODRAFT_252308 [Trametes coccinea BRFM310]|uniref:Uncharacterized protein n=1 Tax=Trametes coccinea (strain BRFM310) TaxID=1353009 RepID=A0A1Y2ITE3_TRAC3|nr:hypothetical protein PYCCODRAFT_252308 [Trametes coccinea BRFM310]